MSRTLILSDIHFCRPSSGAHSFEQVLPLCEGCDALILNGDTADMHSSTHGAQSMAMTDSLISAAHEMGVSTTLLGGNHDPTISDLDFVWMNDNTILVFHGHATFDGVAPWSWRSKYIAKTRHECLDESGKEFEDQLAAVRVASIKAATGAFSNHRPRIPYMMLLSFPAVFHVLCGWWNFPALTEHWVETYAPTAKFIITGHTHHGGIWERNNRIIVNTGCFGRFGFPSRPRAVIIDDGLVRVHKIKKHMGVYSLGGVSASWEVR